MPLPPINTLSFKLKDKEPPEPIAYKFSGTVVDTDTNLPLAGVKVKDNYKIKDTTDSYGYFFITGSYLPSNPLSLQFNIKKYSSESLPIKTQQNSIKSNPVVIKLKSNKKALEEQKLKAQGWTKDQIQKLKDFSAKDFITKLSEKIIEQIKARLIPAILTLLMEFGITKLEEMKGKAFEELNATCPADIKGLNNIIKKKNQLTKQLNNIYNSINRIKDFLNIPEKIISTSEKAIPPLDIAIKITSFIPSTAVTPIPVGPILLATEGIKLLKDLIKVNKNKILGGVLNLDILLGELKKVLNLLNMLDTLVQGCAQEIGDKTDGEVLTQTDITQELIDSTETQSNQLSPVVTNVNGFDMGVETEITGDPLKRRRATAKNKEGVVVLTGEYSYSSNDQILIDELVFYIQQNDLKAE